MECSFFEIFEYARTSIVAAKRAIAQLCPVKN